MISNVQANGTKTAVTVHTSAKSARVIKPSARESEETTRAFK